MLITSSARVTPELDAQRAGEARISFVPAPCELEFLLSTTLRAAGMRMVASALSAWDCRRDYLLVPALRSLQKFAGA